MNEPTPPEWQALPRVPGAVTPAQLWEQCGLQPVLYTWKEYINKKDKPVKHWSPLPGTTGGLDNAPFPTFKGTDEPWELYFRPPLHGLILDVDDHDGSRQGGRTIAAMEAELGPLPPSHKITSRPTDVDSPYGKRLYRIPPDLIVSNGPFMEYGGSVDAIRTGWRNARAPGQVHRKTMLAEVCYGPDGKPSPLPHVDTWPELPERWIEYFRTFTYTSPKAKGSNDGGSTERAGSVRKLPRPYADALLARAWEDYYGTPGDEGKGARGKLLIAARVQVQHDQITGETTDVEALARKHPDYDGDELGASAQQALDDGEAFAGRHRWELGGDDPSWLDDLVPEAKAGRKLRVTRASEITPRASRWLWAEGSSTGTLAQLLPNDHWLPLGGFCLFGGRESSGKSSLSFLLAAQVTKGELPGDLFGKPRSVIIAATEDDWERTIVPRLMAAGADLDRVLRVEAEHNEITSGLTLPTDVVAVRELCDAEDVALLVLDPVMSAIEGELDPHVDRDVRQALDPLSRFAHETGVTIVGLIHLNKTIGTDLLNRVMGSRAFVAVARVVLMAAREIPEHGVEHSVDRYLFGQCKNNLEARAKQTKVFEIHGVKVAHDDETGKDIYKGRVEFVDSRAEYIDDVEAEQVNRKPPRETKADRCEDWLESFLAGEGPVPADQVKAAGKAAGFSRSLLYRAKDVLDVIVAPIEATRNKTTWELEGEDAGIPGIAENPGTVGIVETASPESDATITEGPRVPTFPQSQQSQVPPRARAREGPTVPSESPNGAEPTTHRDVLLRRACGECGLPVQPQDAAEGRTRMVHTWCTKLDEEQPA